MKIYKYQSYDEYIDKQVEANHAKLEMVYVEKKTIKKISKDKKTADRILCHGTRNAAEQKHFNKYFSKAEIIGTEVSDTAHQFPMTVQHDFNLPKEEWKGAFDIVYSNAFDHVYDPLKTLKLWAEQLAPDGLLYIEHGYGERDNKARAWDPIEINDSELRDLFIACGLTLLRTFESNGLKGRVPCRIYVLSQVLKKGFTLKPCLCPTFARWLSLCRNYPKLSVLRKMEYEKLENLSFAGSVLDFGGGLKSPYGNIMKGDFTIESINIDPSIEPTYLLESGEVFPVEDEKYDFVVSFNTLEHIYDPLFALREMCRVLKFGGVAYIAVPFMFRIHAHPDDYLRATPSWWTESLKRVGFTSCEITPLVWGRGVTANSISGGTGFLPRKWRIHLVVALDIFNHYFRRLFTKSYHKGYSDRVVSVSQGWFMEIRKEEIL